MKAVAKIIVYLLGVVLLGTLLTPLVFWTLRALEPWALSAGLMNWDPHESDVLVRGPLAFLTTDLQRCFNRALLLAAVLLYFPMAWALGISGLRGLRLHSDPRSWQHLWRGLALGALSLGIFGIGCLLANLYRPHAHLALEQLPKLILTAICVGIAEEFIFRGALFGLCLKAMRPHFALFWTTLLFAIFHFLQPPDKVQISHVTWLSGFLLLPHVFHQFTDPTRLLIDFAPLFVLGWLLGYARMRTQALWLSTGLHIGIVLAISIHGAFTVALKPLAPWIGTNLGSGIMPMAVLLIALGLTWWRLEHEELLPDPKARD